MSREEQIDRALKTKPTMPPINKEELRREFAKVLRDGIDYSFQVRGYVISESVFAYLESKLESHQKQIADLTFKLKAAEEIIERPTRTRINKNT